MVATQTLIAAILAVMVKVGNGLKVTFFDDAYFKGQNVEMTFEGLACFNLPPYINDKTSSVNTNNNCILAFEHANCGGRMERIAPGTPNHGNLQGLDFNDKISSFRQCSPSENTCRRVDVQVDTSETPDMNDVGRQMEKTMEEWYPFVCRLLYSETYEEVGTLTLKFGNSKQGWPGIADAAWWTKTIRANADWYRNRPNDIGSMIHEMTHIVQQHRSGCSSWVVEGFADWVRYFHYEPNRKPNKPGSGSKYTDGYGTSAYFLDWVNARYVPINYWINKDCREWTYNDNIFSKLTGKSVDQHWDEMMRE